jgi:hypothetical protein
MSGDKIAMKMRKRQVRAQARGGTGAGIEAIRPII